VLISTRKVWYSLLFLALVCWLRSLLDVGVAGLEIEVELALLGLGLAKLDRGELVLLGKIVDPAFLDADIFGGGIKPGLRLADPLVGTVIIDQGDVGRTHRSNPFGVRSILCIRSS